MPLSALVLVLVAAVAHAAWNIVAARSTGSGLLFLWWGQLASALLWAAAIPFTGGLGTGSLGTIALGIGASAVLHLGYMLVLQRGYASGELSTVYATARGSGPMLTVLVSLMFFGEHPSLIAILGVLLVVTGVVSFGLIGRRQAGGIAGRRLVDPAIVYGLLTGVAIASYTVWDVFVVNALGAAPVSFFVGSSIGQVILLSGLLARQQQPIVRLRREFAAHWRAMLTFGILSPLSYVLVLTAATMAPLSLVAPLREVSVVLVGLYGVFVYRESQPVMRLASAAVVVLGAALLAM